MRKIPLKQARLEKGIPQMRIAFGTGLAISQPLYSSIECGYRRVSADEKKMIANVLDVDPERIEWPVYLGDLNGDNAA